MQLKSFRDYVDLKQGLAINKGTDYLVSNKKENEFKIPLLRIADLISGTFSKFVSEEVNPNVIAGKNDIIYTRTGQIGLAFNGFEGVVHNNSFIVTIKEDKKGELNQDYLFTVLNSDFVRNQAISLAHSSVQPDLTHEMFKNILFPLPNIEEQRRIAKIYNILTRKIDNNKAVCANLESMAKTLYDYWFVQFDFPDDNGHPYKTSGGKMEWNEILSREIPVGWKYESVKDSCDIQYGYPFDTNLFSEEKGVPVVRIRDIQELSTSAYTIEDVDKKYHIKRNDLIVGMDGNFHMNFWAGKDALLNQRIFRIRGTEDISTLSVYFAIKPYIEHREKNVTRTTVGHLSDYDVKSLKLILPSDTWLRKKIARKFESILNHITQIREENWKLVSVREFLLPMLMNGQVTFHQ